MHGSGASSAGGEEATSPCTLVTCPDAVVIAITQGLGFSWKRKKGALDAVPSVKVNHDGVSPPGPSYLRRAEEAHSQGKMA